MSYQLKLETKKLLSQRIGIPYEKLIQMDDEEIEDYIEKKTGKKITWPKGAKVDGLPVETIEETTKKMDKYIEELKELGKTNPELAKKKARENLQRVGIIDKDGKLAPPYNGQKVNENDFTMGPGEMRNLDQEER